MATQKYKQYYDLMVRNNQKDLDKFKKIHDQYQTDPQMYSAIFHKAGRNILDIMRSYERKLCAGMERSNNGAYSDKLAEKFWQEIRKEFPLIDQVGVKIRQVKVD